MYDSNKIIQFCGIPFTAFLSVIFGLLLVSFPMGIFVIFESDIGDDINYDFPLTHLELFRNTSIYQSPIDISIGDAFVFLWVLYALLFSISVLGPKQDFLKSFTSIISSGKYDTRSNYMLGITTWLSILILISAAINAVQQNFGIEIIPPMDMNPLTQFFYVSLAPLIEELGFRLILIGIPLYAMYSSRFSFKYFFRCLWSPTSLDIVDNKKAILLIVFVGILFGFAHIAFGDSWSEGKFAQATAAGIILGWVYLRFGFIASVLIHWATNYFIFSYANFISQINAITIESAFSHSLMSTIELLLLLSGIASLSMIFIQKLFSKKENSLQV
ncbi:MAG: CPBP family intramembrane glutamic endopeptidase [Nitrosopumilus sp.]